MDRIELRKAENSYYILAIKHRERVYISLEEVFNHLLQYYEGLAPTFTGSMYGEVIIKREKPK